jgi:hypothetical protein
MEGAMRGFDFDRFLRKASDPLIAGNIHIEGDMLVAYIYAHNGVFPSCIGVKSNSRYLIEQERADMILQLMRRGANVHVCETQRELQRTAQRLWPANVLAWIRSDVEKTHERNRAKAK